MEVEVDSPLMLLNNSFIEFLLPVLTTLNSAALDILITRARMISSGDATMVPVNYKIKLLLEHSGLLLPMNQSETRGYFTCGVPDSH